MKVLSFVRDVRTFEMTPKLPSDEGARLPTKLSPLPTIMVHGLTLWKRTPFSLFVFFFFFLSITFIFCERVGRTLSPSAEKFFFFFFFDLQIFLLKKSQ